MEREDDSSAAFARMSEESQRRIGGIAREVTNSVFDADGFPWRSAGALISRHVRQLAPGADFGDAITGVVCATYAECGFPHDPAAVRQAVAQQLAAKP